ncbi:hypothetical protein SAMN05880558_11251 [Aeromonas sp. RU39B]|jgi:hypothetical protein|nr:hypothetical protein [Aeromonas sp. RU39B]SIR35041.1 hypothetical protein SAMN05880558_11251 [Aeromonas sp. RU39B]
MRESIREEVALMRQLQQQRTEEQANSKWRKRVSEHRRRMSKSQQA